LGIVLHRTRAQRVKADVDGKVQLGEPREVPHHFELSDLGEREIVTGQVGRERCFGHVSRRQFDTCAAWNAPLEYQRVAHHKISHLSTPSAQDRASSVWAAATAVPGSTG